MNVSGQSPNDELTLENLAQVDRIIASYQGRAGALIPVLHQCQETFGYLPKEVQLRVAEGLHLSPAEVFGVVTFYHFFTMQPRGRCSIRACMGTACFVRGAPTVLQTLEKHLHLRPGETTSDREYSLETVACIGACALAPTVVVDGVTYGLMNPSKVEELLTERGVLEGDSAQEEEDHE